MPVCTWYDHNPLNRKEYFLHALNSKEMNLGTLGQEWLIVATPEGYAVKKLATRGEYSISTYGMSLFPIIKAMNEWERVISSI